MRIKNNNIHASTNSSSITTTTKKTVILVGNPNVGKSVIFGYLTGKYATVSNYPGTTVEFTHGQASPEIGNYKIIDTPGINSLVPMSEDEHVTLNILLRNNAACVLQVADSKNLRRALLVTSQLATLGMPMALLLNMSDEALDRGIRINRQMLSKILKIPVIETVATTRKGLNHISKIIENCQKPAQFVIDYGEPIEKALLQIKTLAATETEVNKTLSTVILINPDIIASDITPQFSQETLYTIQKIRIETQVLYNEPLNYVVHRAHIKAIDRMLNGILKVKSYKKSSFADLFGKYAMHSVAGLPILIIVLIALWLLVGRFGAGTCVDFLQDSVFNRYLIPWTKSFLNSVRASPFLKDFLVGEFGIISMAFTYALAIVLPIVGFFFLAFGILEDSGYLPRLAVMSNKIFRLMGLNGRAVLPMVLGLGCATMATLTTRILDTKKERIIVTFLLALGVPCSAQLGVILGLLSGLSVFAAIFWALIILGVLFLVGHLSAKIVKGREADFILELPPIRMPQLSNILYKTWIRIVWYLREAVPLFLLGTIILFFADVTGVLTWIEKISEPLVVHILNQPPDVSAAFFVGFLRRDYGAVFLMDAAKSGNLDSVQIVVSLITITLFVPCIANFFMMIKERGIQTALVMVMIIIPFSFGMGGLVNVILRGLNITF